MENAEEEKDRQAQKLREAMDVSVEMSQNSRVQLHGEAAGQILQAYKGTRYDSNGNELEYHGRSLKGVSQYKADNPDYREQNIKQQSGFSAELLKEARDNKEAVLCGDPNRTRTTDGQGSTNDTQYDFVTVDENGNEVAGGRSQMKFLQSGVDGDGGRTFKVMDKLAKDRSWERYDSKVDIPKGDYEDALKYADKQADKLERQAERARQEGKTELAKKREEEADGYRRAKERIRESKVSEQDAIEARVNPERFVANEILHDSHTAGVEAFKGAALFSAAFSISKNLAEVVAEDKPLGEAAEEVAETAVKAGATAYGIVGAGTALKAVMSTSSYELMRRISATAAPTAIVSGALEAAKSIGRYAQGELDELELMEELGEKGCGMAAAGYGAAVAGAAGAKLGAVAGTMTFPVVGTVIGTVAGMLGGMVAYQLSGILYRGAMSALKGKRIAQERREVVEQLARAAIERTVEYRNMLEEYAGRQCAERAGRIAELLTAIDESMIRNDVDGFIQGMDGFGEMFGITLAFDSFEEIDQFMSDPDSVLVL